MVYKKTFGDWVFDSIIYFIAALVIVCTVYPLIYTVSLSISDPAAVAAGKVWLLPVGFDLQAYTRIFEETGFLKYVSNSLFYTIAGTAMGVFFSALAAYPLSRPEFIYRKYLKGYYMLTMFIGGGLIPTYIVMTRFLHLYDSRWAILLPPCAASWYIIVATSFFQTLPGEIVESARLDGASEYRIFGQLILPLSKPSLAVLALYYSVGHWNSYLPAVLYLSDDAKQPLSVYVRRIAVENDIGAMMKTMNLSVIGLDNNVLLSTIQMKYALLVVTVLPMMLIYPMLAKNLEKGVLIGAIKG